MMLGEIDYNEMFYSHDELYDMDQFKYQGKLYNGKLKMTLKPALFPFTAQVFVTIFILFVSIVIVNFLFGLAVYDVQVMIRQKYIVTIYIYIYIILLKIIS